MAKSNDLTQYALEGYNAPPEAKCQHFASSPAELAWKVGVWLKATGRTQPRDVRMSRGYTVRANDMLLDASNTSAIVRIS